MRNPFFDFSVRLLRRTGSLSDLAVSTKPPRTSSVFSAALAAFPFSALRSELSEACRFLRR